MSDEEKNDGNVATAMAAEPSDQPSLDEHTTEPNAPETPKAPAPQASGGKWQMPKPKFQQTSGYLPQGYLKDIDTEPAAPGFAGSEDTTQEQAPYIPTPQKQDGAAAELPAIEPQPDLSDQLIPDESVPSLSEGQVPAKSGSSLPMVVFGIIGIVVFIVIFLAVVYFLILKGPSGGN